MVTRHAYTMYILAKDCHYHQALVEIDGFLDDDDDD
jgi:hypothetical protein